MSKIRYIFCDLDGTLLDDKKEISENTLHIIDMLRREYNVKFGVATGRDAASAIPLLKKLNVYDRLDAIVSNNGVLTQNLISGENIWLPKVKKQQIKSIIDYFAKLPILRVCFHNHNHFYSTILDERSAKIQAMNYESKISNPIEDDSYEDAPRVMLIFDPKDYKEVCKYIDSVQFQGLHSYLSQADVYEYMNDEVSKDRGILSYTTGFNDDLSSVLVFGDSDNDVEMLQNCGLGVAMYNASISAKKVANTITNKSNNEEGVYDFLKRNICLFK